MGRVRAAVAGCVVAAVGLLGCGSDDSTSPATSATDTTVSPATVTTTSPSTTTPESTGESGPVTDAPSTTPPPTVAPTTTVTPTSLLPTTSGPNTGERYVTDPSDDVHVGDTGPAVLQIQDRLVQWGYTMAIDGDFGVSTQNLVKAFQADHGIEVDGIVGRTTWAALAAEPPA